MADFLVKAPLASPAVSPPTPPTPCWARSSGWRRKARSLGIFGCVIRRSLVLAFLLMSGAAQAEWTSVGRFDRGEFFIDRSTLRVKGDQREVWSVMNYRNPEMDQKGQIFRSTRSLLQLHCEARQARAIHMAFFTGAMLGGKQIGEMGSLPGWDKVLPDSPMQHIFDLVCRS